MSVPAFAPRPRGGTVPVMHRRLVIAAALLFCLPANGSALADDLDNAQPQLDTLKAAVNVLHSNKAAVTSLACADQLEQWKTTMEAIHYDTVHHDSDLPVARDVLAMNYTDGARLCGQDAARFCIASPKADGCHDFALAVAPPAPAP